VGPYGSPSSLARANPILHVRCDSGCEISSGVYLVATKASNELICENPIPLRVVVACCEGILQRNLGPFVGALEGVKETT
jgi:hypothetical protein